MRKTERHGLSRTRIYHIWTGMKKRCNNRRAHDYINYGGRGIKVCPKWSNSFLSFYEWSMKHGYNDTLTIDRINVNGMYEPSNCRWVNRSVQNSNKRNPEEVQRQKEETLKQLKGRRVQVECLETSEKFESIKSLAQLLGVSKTLVIRHLNGEKETLKGKHYRRTSN